jgi:DNA-directed RNA polymerase specialized sigma24 family protein
MQQTMVLEDVLDRLSTADCQTSNPSDHPAASVETSELVARASTGDQGAWDQLVARYGGMVWAVAREGGLGPHDAGAVSQVTWLLLTQHLRSLPQPERLGVWLRRTALREAYRMPTARLRGHRRRRGAERGRSSARSRPGLIATTSQVAQVAWLR